MTWVRVLLSRLSALMRARQLDREMDDEIASHLDEATADYVQQGLSLPDARRAALRRFGAVSRAREVHREMRSVLWFEELSRDLRYAVRTLRRNPAFTATAAATLALAIGANTAMFSVLNTVLLRPLPYRSPDQLAMLWTEDPARNVSEGRAALWDVEQWRVQTQTFADLATVDTISTLLTTSDGVEQLLGASVSPNLLPVLGVQPILGRAFSAADAGQRVVMISHRFWQARFGGAPAVLGTPLVIDGVPSEIVGVLPAGFQAGRIDVDVWRTHATTPAVRGGQTWFVIGRLRPGTTVAQAQGEMSAIARRVNEQLPLGDRSQGISVVPLRLYLVAPQTRLALWVLGAAVFGVFLIAAANVASLSLARSSARTREMTVRAALGANAGRIVRQLLTESAVLAVVSGAIGTLLALGAVRLIRAYGPDTLPGLTDVTLDPRGLGWAFAMSLLAAALVGLAPAVTTGRRNLKPTGEESGRTVSGGKATRRIRRGLVIAEFAMSIVLLVGAGLLVRSWWHVSAVDPGFVPDRVLVMQIASPPSVIQPAQRTDLYRRVLDEVRAVPGVESAGIADDLFSSNPREHLLTVERQDGTVSERLRLTSDEISDDFFEALGTPLRRGRFFSSVDRMDAPPSVIVNEALARRFWPEQDPIGRRLALGPRESNPPWFTVVGVVADMRRQGPEREPLPQMFVSVLQRPPSRNVGLFIRTSSDAPLTMAGSLRAAVRRVERNVSIDGVAPLEQLLGTYLVQRRFQTSLLAGFSVVALVMAAVGIYGLIQYSIATRTKEIGLRLAIGAQSGDIFRMFIAEGLTLSLTGAAIGLLGALWLGRTGSSLLFGVRATDPATFVTVSLLLTAVAVAACYFPARRAMKTDPIVALRTS